MFPVNSGSLCVYVCVCLPPSWPVSYSRSTARACMCLFVMFWCWFGCVGKHIAVVECVGLLVGFLCYLSFSCFVLLFFFFFSH